MAKSFNDMAASLKDFIADINSDARHSKSFKPRQYNNLKISMNPDADTTPHVIISIAISEAKYNINTLEKVNGSLGPDERVVQRWLGRSGVAEGLKELWKSTQENNSRSKKEHEDEE